MVYFQNIYLAEKHLEKNPTHIDNFKINIPINIQITSPDTHIYIFIIILLEQWKNDSD